MIDQYAIHAYRTGLYFLKCKLETECGEFGNEERDIESYVIQQKIIANRLNCTFIHYNPL